MKNIKNFNNKKYEEANYEAVEEFVYKYNRDGGIYYCTPISFEQEPEFGEGDSSEYISQYPIEDILEQFGVYVTDFFEELNNGDSNECYYEFSSDKLEEVITLKKTIIGKHVYNEEYGEFVKLVIE